MFQYIASSWNHEGDPVELLQINTSVSEFRRALKENPAFLQDKVRRYFKVSCPVSAEVSSTSAGCRPPQI